jgi:drug/metabolite transporter (DMT)-like permease
VAQRYTPSTHAALILCLEAVFAVIFSYLFWGEELTVRMVIGCVFIFAGVIVTELKPGLPMLGRPRVKEKRGKILPRETE